MPTVLSVNLGTGRVTAHSDVGLTGIDKRPSPGPVQVRPPGAHGGGLVGDAVCDQRHHGGEAQAVYAYSREDLDEWQTRLGRALPSGVFGENLTTSELDVTGAVLGEQWHIGSDLVLQVSGPRIPCRTFAGWLGIPRWVKTFTERGAPGAYLRVLHAGSVRAGDRLEVRDRPEHGVNISVAFRALTNEPALLPRLLEADALAEKAKVHIRRRLQLL